MHAQIFVSFLLGAIGGFGLHHFGQRLWAVRHIRSVELRRWRAVRHLAALAACLSLIAFATLLGWS